MSGIKRLYLIFRIHLLYYRLKYLFIKGIQYNQQRIYIFLAADYGNLGDVAITYAQKNMLKEAYPLALVEEIPASRTLISLARIRKTINPSDIVTIVGGGNMGDMYADIELLRLMTVKSFPKNKIILFPQTIHYSKSKISTWLCRLSRKIYQGHGDILMMAREKVSYSTMKSLYPSTNVKLTPDIVMTLERGYDIKRKNIVTLCLREDLEKKIDNTPMVENLKEWCKNQGFIINYHDTHIGSGRFNEEEKYSKMEQLWKSFSESRLIITDRLHGMIFAYITKTPAIVLPNSNFKITGCYEWIKECGYIKMVDNSDFGEEIRRLLSMDASCYPLQNLKKYFDFIYSESNASED